jgi:hypothetical protein
MLASLGLAVAGSQAAHAATYRLVAPDAHEREHLLAETGHAYLRLAPLGLAFVSVVVALALLAEARSVRGVAGASRPRVWLFALVAPATFVCQEVFERLLHDGAFPWGAPLEKTFVVGLALQLPFALTAWLLARLLLHAARALGRLLAARAPARATAAAGWAVHTLSVARPAACGLAFGPRGPPAPSH